MRPRTKPEILVRAVNGQRATAWLEAALVFTLLAHAAGMVSMALLLLPGMPGGPHDDIAARAAYVADHPWLWRAGWLPWQLTAASDLILGLALVLTRWIPKAPAIVAVVLTIAAIIPDQVAQVSWTWSGVEQAKLAMQAGDFVGYLRFESRVFVLMAGWGAAGYLIGAIAWTWCFATAGTWSRWLTWLSAGTWGLFAVAVTIVFFREHLPQTPMITTVVSAGNAVAFFLLMIWLVGVTEAVFQRSRPETPHGSRAPWRHPSAGLVPRMIELIANSRLARAAGRLLPAAGMASDITDVVYVNYLVEASAVEPLVAAPLELQRLGPDGRYAMFTFLTYHHGHFGPTVLGPLRRLCPSPIQSNWRLYVQNPRTGRLGIQFVTTAIASAPHALATRILAEGVPMHIPAAAQLSRDADGPIVLAIDPGRGTAPDVQATFTPSSVPNLEPPWSLCFASWREILGHCVPQDRAMSMRPGSGVVTRQEITLDIPLESCQPLSGTVVSSFAHTIVGDATPLCFVVDSVKFRFVAEKADRCEGGSVCAVCEAARRPPARACPPIDRKS
jgi:hypothetical protein